MNLWFQEKLLLRLKHDVVLVKELTTENKFLFYGPFLINAFYKCVIYYYVFF